jgi:hypothetical protein
MSQKRRPVPGADRIDDLVNAVGEGWKHEVDGIDVRAVGLFTRVFVLSRLETLVLMSMRSQRPTATQPSISCSR